MSYPRLPSTKVKRTNNIIRYAGIASQLFAAIAIAVFAGFKLDAWLKSTPVFVCALPLLTLGLIFYKLIKETAPKGGSHNSKGGTPKQTDNEEE